MGTQILLLVDYRRAFWSSTRNIDTLCSLNVDRLRTELNKLGHQVEVLEFAELDLSRKDLRGTHVIYTSSEDVGAHYKRYIEAKVFGLRMAGALPIPEPELLMAHHDKVMMESVRQARLSDAPGQLESLTFGTLEEFLSVSPDWAAEPTVMKPAQGAGSRGVTLVQNRKEGFRTARRLSRSFDLRGTVAELLKRRRYADYISRSLHRQAIVLQQFLPNLNGDYKVLRYGERFYVLGRANRPNDFRASGSGRLDYSPSGSVDIYPLLDAAMLWSDAIGSPFCSLDVAYDPISNVDPHLIEFQCVNFGPATAENSNGYYVRRVDGWTRLEEACDLEWVFAMATSAHIGSGASVANGA
jgi:glutathione synthase/RimK-type ligase-like ATP-grasp enzyme